MNDVQVRQGLALYVPPMASYAPKQVEQLDKDEEEKKGDLFPLLVELLDRFFQKPIGLVSHELGQFVIACRFQVFGGPPEVFNF